MSGRISAEGTLLIEQLQRALNAADSRAASQITQLESERHVTEDQGRLWDSRWQGHLQKLAQRAQQVLEARNHASVVAGEAQAELERAETALKDWLSAAEQVTNAAMTNSQGPNTQRMTKSQ